jgi:hypothetical protein
MDLYRMSIELLKATKRYISLVRKWKSVLRFASKIKTLSSLSLAGIG